MQTELATLFNDFKSGVVTSPQRASLGSTPLFIYGAGGAGKSVHGVLTDAGYIADAFLDAAAKPGSTWQGIPILTPEAPEIVQTQRSSGLVIIGVFNTFAEIPPIKAKLRQLGFANIMTFADFHSLFASALGDRYWLTSRSFYLEHQSAIETVQNFWSDQRSRDIYCSVLRFRLFGDYEGLPVGNSSDQYFPGDLPNDPRPLRFVDCGAFDGDCLEQILRQKLPLEAVAAFEPDDTNFGRLNAYVSAHRNVLPRDVFLYPCGVDSATRKVRFSSGQGAASRVDDSGDTVVQCTSIDEALPGFGPTLIKMDIEGAEPGALWGARRTIMERRPALAICVYHRPAHLWQIPQMVVGWYGEAATYHLRAHGFNGFDLVLYVRPN